MYINCPARQGASATSLLTLLRQCANIERSIQVGRIEDQDLFSRRVEEIEPLLRYCRYNLDTATGDAAAAEEHLLEMEREESSAGGDLLAAKLESVVTEARKKQASALDSVEWRGKKVAVRSEILRVALVKADELARRLGAGGQGGAAAGGGGGGSSSEDDPKPGQYLKVFGAYDDALRTVSEEALRLQGKGGGIKMEAHRAELEALRAYAQHHKLRLMLQRNERLVQELQEKRKAGGGAGGDRDRDRDPVGEVADIVHVYDALLQSVRNMVTNLGGGEDANGERGERRGNRPNELYCWKAAVGRPVFLFVFRMWLRIDYPDEVLTSRSDGKVDWKSRKCCICGQDC